MPAANYQVQLDVFSGPLDLLLFLVRRDEIALPDLSLERLTAQYVEFLEANAAALRDLDTAGDFIAVAAQLLYLKSRQLLPPDELPADDAGADDAALDDPRWELIRQLLEYKRFKEAAAALAQRESARLDLFTRPPAAADADAHAALAAAAAQGSGGLALEELSTLDLLNAFHRLLRRLTATRRTGGRSAREIYEERFTVADKIDELLRRLESLEWTAGAGASLAFEELFSPTAPRAEWVVTFLALLELVRMKKLRVMQEAGFGEIRLARKEGLPTAAAAVQGQADASG
ncbi:MAG: segregation/condensation protein A [Verrucomicrobia bacterium]|nr:segregation/condensation protein A [Verrucomicrobiota bacterium]